MAGPLALDTAAAAGSPVGHTLQAKAGDAPQSGLMPQIKTATVGPSLRLPVVQAVAVKGRATDTAVAVAG